MLCNERDKSYIYDILKYSQEVIDIVKDENHNSFVNNRIKRLAIERLIQIIGEAANHLSGDFIQENQTFTAHCVIGHARCNTRHGRRVVTRHNSCAFLQSKNTVVSGTRMYRSLPPLGFALIKSREEKRPSRLL